MSSPTMNVMLPFFGAPSPEDVFLETVRFQVPSLSAETLKVANAYNNNDAHVNNNSIVVCRKKREREWVDSKQSTERVVNSSLSSEGVNDKRSSTCNINNNISSKETEETQTRNKSSRNACAVEYKDLTDLLEYAHFNHRTPWHLLLVRYATDLSKSSTGTNFSGGSSSSATGNITQNEDTEQIFTTLSLYEQVEFARSALRHALSVIARLVHCDTLGFFTFAPAATVESDSLSNYHEIKEELQVMEKTDMKETKVFSSTDNCNITNKEVRSLLTLYCKIQALELELNDLVLQVRDDHWKSRSNGNHNKTSTSEKDDSLSETLCTIEECVNALETTIIDILLALPLHGTPTTENVNVNSNISAIDNSSLLDMPSIMLTHIQQTHFAEFSYIVQLMLESLPNVCETLDWPCQLVHLGRSESKNNNNSNVTTNAHHKQIGENECYETKRQLMCSGAANAITSIVLESMLQLKKNDCNSTLQVTTSQSKTLSPTPLLHQQHQEQTEQSISVLAALQLARQNDTHNLLLWEEHLTVNELAAKAWRGAYSKLGIRIAMLEMRLVFYKQYRILIDEIQTANVNNMHKHKNNETNKSSTAANKHSKVSTTTTINVVAHNAKGKQNIIWILEKLTHLREQEMYWKRLLQTNYANFLNSVYQEIDDDYCEWQQSEMLLDDNIFDILEMSSIVSSNNALLSELQLICMRVVKRLRWVDKNGWFAIPAFDLVNIDFTSVEMWIRNKNFARKSHRAAFEALRAVLEQMVDNCVAQYGPTHEFSLLITTVRQEFVSIARQEKLL